jgi:hypothetical protein
MDIDAEIGAVDECRRRVGFPPSGHQDFPFGV